MGRRISKHRSGHARKGQNNAIVSRTKRMAKLVTIKGWDCEDEPTGWYGWFNFHVSIPKDKRVAVHDYICQTPNRWYIKALCHVKYADGSRAVLVADGETGQPCLAKETKDARAQIMEEASGSVNPKWIESQTYEMRVIG